MFSWENITALPTPLTRAAILITVQLMHIVAHQRHTAQIAPLGIHIDPKIATI
jgi:hypothetical protein